MLEDVKLLVFDLDGTLLNEKKCITERTKQELKKASELGIRICLASGRFEKMMYLESEVLDCVDFMVSSNGAQICNQEKKVIYKNTLNAQDFEGIFTLIKQYGYNAMIYSSDTAYYPLGKENMLRKIDDYKSRLIDLGFTVDYPICAYDKIEDFKDINDISKVVIYQDISILKEFIDKELKRFNISYESTGYGLLGIFNNGVSKYSALEKVKSLLSIKSSQVAVFGDFDNDLSMFSSSDHCVAMKNGSDLLKKEADYITDFTNDEEGVADFIHKYVINVHKDEK